MQSACWIVDKRCAIAIVVRPAAALLRAFWTAISEFASRADVAYGRDTSDITIFIEFRLRASSSSNILGLRMRARAIAIRSTNHKSRSNQ
jgi:hypothetical protein